jgi:hypothetical protein
MDSIADFMSLTDTKSSEEAQMWLEAANFDFEVAVDMFFSTTGYSFLILYLIKNNIIL